MSGLTVAEVLERAADLIEPEGRWTQGELARDAIGKPLPISAVVSGNEADCFCAWGAIAHVYGELPHNTPAAELFCEVIGSQNVGSWNDDPERTQAEVVAKLREAAAAAREVQS